MHQSQGWPRFVGKPCSCQTFPAKNAKMCQDSPLWVDWAAYSTKLLHDSFALGGRRSTDSFHTSKISCLTQFLANITMTECEIWVIRAHTFPISLSDFPGLVLARNGAFIQRYPVFPWWVPSGILPKAHIDHQVVVWVVVTSNVLAQVKKT